MINKIIVFALSLGFLFSIGTGILEYFNGNWSNVALAIFSTFCFAAAIALTVKANKMLGGDE